MKKLMRFLGNFTGREGGQPIPLKLWIWTNKNYQTDPNALKYDHQYKYLRIILQDFSIKWNPHPENIFQYKHFKISVLFKAFQIP